MMKTKLIILFIFIVSLLRSQTIIYIDPDNHGTQNGTITYPYDSWRDFTITTGYTYLQKAGTIAYLPTGLYINCGIYISNVDNVTLGAYGVGSKPILKHINNGGNYTLYVNRSENIVIDGFDLEGYPARNGVGLGVFGIPGATKMSKNITIQNCDIHDFDNGVRAMALYDPEPRSVEDINVINCNVWNIDSDGIYFDGISWVDVLNSHVWNVNMGWFKRPAVAAPGDGIQLTWSDAGAFWNVNIIGNTVDRRTTAGKFCIIVANIANETPPVGAYTNIIGNTIYPTKDTLPRYPGDGTGGCGIYLENWSEGNWTPVTVANNLFIGDEYASPSDGHGQPALLEMYFTTANIYGNIFRNTSVSSLIQTNLVTNFWNNTVIGDQGDIGGSNNFTIRISANTGSVRNNLSATTATEYAINKVGTATMSNNLQYYGSSANFNTQLGIVDWANDDYHLVVGSPAIDAGYNVGLSYDFDSLPIPQNGIYDIGAYEYNAGLPPVGDPPVANFSANDVSAYIGQTISFTDLSTENPTSWDWTFDPITITYVGGTSSTSQNPQVQFTANGTYNVSLEATNAEGSDTETKTGYITVAAIVGDANFSASPVVTGINTKVDFTDLSTSPLTWLWTFNPATVTYLNGTTNASQHPDVEFDAIGLYDVTLYITVAGGNDTEIKLDYINVLAAPVTDFSVSSTKPYIGDVVQFTDLSTEKPTSWLWTFSPTSVTYENGTSNTSQNPQVSFDAAGLYTVTLRATNAYGNDSEIKADYISAQIVFTNPPVADFVASDRTINATQTVTFYNLTTFESPMRGLGDFTYVWVFEGGTPSTSTETNPIITYNTAGKYDVTLTATNSDGYDDKIKRDYITVDQENTPARGILFIDDENVWLLNGLPLKY